MWTTIFYQIFFKNILLCMKGRLSKIRSLHTHVIPRTVYFGWICTLIWKLLLTLVDRYLRTSLKEHFKICNQFWKYPIVAPSRNKNRCVYPFWWWYFEFTGLGFKKRSFMHFSKSQPAIGAMQQIKQVFDPHGIMNPYKVLPPSTQFP